MKTWEKKKPEKKRKESPEDVEDETSSTTLIPPTTPIPPTTTIPPTTPTRTIRPCTPITTRPSTSATSRLFNTDSPMASGISKNLLDQLRSRPVVVSPGTPAEAHPDSDEDDMLVNRNIDLVKEGNVRKAHCGGITTVNMFDVEVCDSNGFYRASISDGKDLSNKVLFNSKLNKKVKDELVGPGKVSIVRLDVTDILEKTIVGVMAFTRLDDGPDHVGDAQFLGDTFYRVLKPRGCMTPSRMKKNKLFK